MSWLFVTLTVLILIACALLVLVVLLQNGKGGGLASNFVTGNQTLGVRQTADLLERVTWGLVTFILVAAIISSFTFTKGGSQSDITDQAQVEQTENPEADFSGAIDVENVQEENQN